MKFELKFNTDFYMSFCERADITEVEELNFAYDAYLERYATGDPELLNFLDENIVYLHFFKTKYAQKNLKNYQKIRAKSNLSTQKGFEQNLARYKHTSKILHIPTQAESVAISESFWLE